jgi:maltooligosyltrehalose trehalohydrolase
MQAIRRAGIDMLDYRPRRGFGANIENDGVRFRFWAPTQQRVLLVLDDEKPVPMDRTDDRWHEHLSQTAKPGTLYKYVLEDGSEVPDPASRYQPADVHGPSEVIDPHSYNWNDGGWKGRPWEESVIYELHIGAFTQEGTFRSAIERLDYLAELGVTVIELMPVADFPGDRNWGYDGVLLFAPDSSYGRPEDLKALIDAAHARKMMVFLDVVYNHFGPDGNYLSAYAPIFTEHHQTPWGAAVNFDDEGSNRVRELVIQNAEYWISEFHFDGLRLDAVHAIKDDSRVHILDELASRVRNAARHRQVHLLLENEENEVSPLERAHGRPIYYTAQWNDDVHHVLHAAATGETSGYYGDYIGNTEKLGRALAQGFAFQGELMESRGSPRGEPSGHLPPTAFVSFIQNHDQVGNRALGDRLTSFAPAAAVRAIISIYLLLPQIPMLFMGEEFGATQPFPFFAQFEPELADAVREGRRAEFASFPEFANPNKREAIPDPTSERTFRSAKLIWQNADKEPHAEWLAIYRKLLSIRRAEIVPRLRNIGGNSGRFEVRQQSAVSVRWTLGDGTCLRLAANLADRKLSTIATNGRRLWSVGSVGDTWLGPWSVIWTIEE